MIASYGLWPFLSNQGLLHSFPMDVKLVPHWTHKCVFRTEATHTHCASSLQLNLIIKSYITFLPIFAKNTFYCLHSVKHFWVTCSDQGGWSIALSRLYNPNKYYPDLHFESRHQNNPNLELCLKKPDILLTGRAYHEYNINDCSHVGSYIKSAGLQLPVTPNPPGSTIRGVFIRGRGVWGGGLHGIFCTSCDLWGQAEPGGGGALKTEMSLFTAAVDRCFNFTPIQQLIGKLFASRSVFFRTFSCYPLGKGFPVSSYSVLLSFCNFSLSRGLHK